MLGHRVAASSTIGTFLRAFGYGHARQLDAATRRLLARAVAAGAHAGLEESVTIDIDSTLCETYGLGKDGARKVMRTGRRGYHPLLAVIAGTQGPAGISGVIAHARLRRGRSSDATSAPPQRPTHLEPTKSSPSDKRPAGNVRLGMHRTCFGALLAADNRAPGSPPLELTSRASETLASTASIHPPSAAVTEVVATARPRVGVCGPRTGDELPFNDG